TLDLPNTIVDGPQIPGLEVATLDTLLQVTGGTTPPGVILPVMTIYHGVENPTLVFSGHNLWSYKRDDVKQLVDFVLQEVWHMPGPGGGAGARPRAARQPVGSASTPVTALARSKR